MKFDIKKNFSNYARVTAILCLHSDSLFVPIEFLLLPDTSFLPTSEYFMFSKAEQLF